MKNKIIYLLIGILLGCVVTNIYFYNNKPNDRDFYEELPFKDRNEDLSMRPDNDIFNNEEKETMAIDIDRGVEVSEKEIDLNDYSSNILITNPGEYILKGELNNSILIDSTDDVTLILNNIKIESEITSAIANIGSGSLTIRLASNTENILKDQGSSEYDACIYSKGPLFIEGEGVLSVHGNQKEGEGIATETNDITINGGIINIESNDDGINAGGDGGLITINDGTIFIKAGGDGIDSNKNLIINGGYIYTIGSSQGGDAGIDTDDGFEINGGTLIALGTDMLEKPLSSSSQNYVSFNLDNKISKGSIIVLKDEFDNEVISFEAKGEFKTLIISNDQLSDETYQLYINNQKSNYNSKTKGL